MKNNSLIKCLMIVCALMVLVGCKKDKNTITEYTGIVVEGTEQTGLPDVNVSVTNDEGRKIVFTSTDEEGAFSMFVNFEKVTDGCYLLVDGSPELPFQKKYDLKGMGKNKYDYGTLPLFNKSKTTVETNEVTEITANSAVCGGVITCGADVHIVERGVCWSKSPHPVITPDGSSQTSDGEGSGSFLSYLRGLEEKTEYFVKAYAKTKEGVLVYDDEGPEVKFTTKAFITAKRVTDIDVLAGSAKCGGFIAAENDNVVLERGVCWATHENPKIENDPHTSDGQGNGEFFSDITGLQEQTTYYVRAYARTESTVKYAATDPLSFTTPALLPTFQHDGTTYYVHPEAGTMTWQTAMDFCDGLTFAGYSDWFLPNKVELNAMYVKQDEIGGFENVDYWSSTEYSNISSWYHNFGNGDQGRGDKSERKRVRPVRKDGGSGGGTTPTTPTVTTNAVITYNSSSATCGGNVTSTGGADITERGVYYGTSPDPVTTGQKKQSNTSGTGIGSFTCSLTGLLANTKYYYCAYAINSVGESPESNVESFTTLGSGGGTTPTAPTVTTNTSPTVTSNSAICKGRVTDEGSAPVILKGVCYCIGHEPTISDLKVYDGNGIGTISCELKNLTPNTTYNFRAFAINSAVAEPGYGSIKTFTTEVDYPTVSTGTHDDPTNTSVVCYGNLVSDGGSPIIEMGISYCGSLYNPTSSYGRHIPASGTNVGPFSCEINNLLPGTYYKYCAYAINSEGLTDYGDVSGFTTTGGHVEGWLQYDNGNGTNALGFEEGGTLYWANMFPSSMLSSYEGTSVTKVEAYLNMVGVYTLRLYSGGTTSPGSLICQHNFNHNYSSAVWATMTLPEAVSLNTSQNLWVVISVTHSAGESPAGCCQNTGNPNGRWYSDGVEWGDVENYTWGMHTFVSNGVKGEIQIGDKQPMGITHLKKKANVDKYHGIKSIKRRQ